MAGLPKNRIPTSARPWFRRHVLPALLGGLQKPRVTLLILLAVCFPWASGCENEDKSIRIDTFFCQDDLGFCGETLVSVIAGATTTLEGAIYSLTLTEVADALADAVDRGVSVWVVYESDQVKDDMIDILEKGGVFLRADGNSAAMHHKFLVADGKVVVNGSFNWTNNANYNNDENLQVIYSADIASLFSVEFLRLWEAAVP